MTSTGNFPWATTSTLKASSFDPLLSTLPVYTNSSVVLSTLSTVCSMQLETTNVDGSYPC